VNEQIKNKVIDTPAMHDQAFTEDALIRRRALAFMVMQEAFARAKCAHADKVHESFYIFAGRVVQIRIIGHRLAGHIVCPFSHLWINEPPPTPPQLIIDLWDENETGIHCQANSTIDDHRWFEATVKSPDGRFIAQRLPNTVSCLDRQDEHIIGSIAWNDLIFIYERAKPLARLLLEWHNDRNIQIIHAGLVSLNDKGILFVGRSGSGKTTAALTCACAGFNFLSEDYVGLQGLLDGSFIGHSLYNSVFVETNHLTKFGDLAQFVIRGRPTFEEKSALILGQVFPDRLKRFAPIYALVLPRVVPDARVSQIRPASKGEALLALAPSSLLQIPSTGLRGFDKLAQLVEKVPCYWLEFGNSTSEIPYLAEQILKEMARL
jgi:hypothetical protein